MLVEFIIVVDELEKVYERCCEYNYPIEVEVEQYPWEMRGFKITDPDGYFLRITSK
ncbi:VOC family protein [Robertmurraya massiliosenegalensis]|uniref:VOC family protein n=1 Tax=Robertmurraya TaxID=2837507 RepID=UPI0039A4873E